MHRSTSIIALFAAALSLFLLTGCGMPSFLVTPVSNTNKLEEQTVQDGKGFSPAKIAIIEVEGLLINAKSGGFLQPTENDVSLLVQQLERAEKDPAVKAVVLRINSPGGTVSASDLIYQQITRFKTKTNKPIVASTQEVAASGGYYVALAADQIVVQPTSVVGSIGVIFNTFDVSGTLAKIGARSEAIKSGPLKDMGSPFKPLTDPERAVMQSMVDEYHVRFKELVKARRHLDDTRLAAVTDGRVFSGQSAVTLGLADKTGLLDDALDLAKQLSNSPNAKTILYKRPYAYSGSIYAKSPTPQPQSTTLSLPLPPTRTLLPAGFYYLWDPSL